VLPARRLGEVRLLSPRLIAYVTRSHTGERGDDAMGRHSMHRGWGPHVRVRARRSAARQIGAPRPSGMAAPGLVFLGDPTSGVSFTYSPTFMAPGIRWHTDASTGWPPHPTPRSIDHRTSRWRRASILFVRWMCCRRAPMS